MIIQCADKVNRDEYIKNCRIQSLCDLLCMKGIQVSPNLLYLCCLKTLYVFSEITFNHVTYPFLSSFDEDIEVQFFEHYKLKYDIKKGEISFLEMKNILKSENPFIIFCDANSLLKNKKNNGNTQIGVFSGITIIGYNKLGQLIFSQQTRKKKFGKISFNLLTYASKFNVLPASPKSTSIYLIDDEVSFQECHGRLNNYDDVYSILKQNIEAAVSVVQPDTPYSSNMGVDYYENQEAKEKLFNFLYLQYDLINNISIDKVIIDKIFSLKIRMLRKTMVSGTNTFHRHEIAEAVNSLYKLNPNKKVENLYIGFKNSAINFRSLIRFLYFVDNRLNDKEGFLDEVIRLFKEALEYEHNILLEFLS